MSFYSVIEKYRDFDFSSFAQSLTNDKISSILGKSRLTELDYLSLLTPAAAPFIEEMAQRSAALTRQHFGNCIFIFTPFYISNFCDNVCAYCSFAHQHSIERRQLTYDQIRAEAERIAASGIRHILVLTGESRRYVTNEYLEESLRIISEYFSSIAIEVFPLIEEEYSRVGACGADALTIYQETYDEKLYKQYHPRGPKSNYRFRLETPERACRQGFRAVTVGPLFGLYNPVSEAFFMGMHADYIQRTYPSVEVSVSLPRLRPLVEKFESPFTLDDKMFVQYMTALRLFLPFAGITVSTRESENFRNAIAPLGVTKMSAGVSTAVGGRAEGKPSTAQFEIADERSVDQVKKDLQKSGLQAVMHDWNARYVRDVV